jgi:hypothetical protein
MLFARIDFARWTYTAAGLLAAALVAAAQAPADKCRVEGTVLNALTGQPVRKAHITLTPDQGGALVLGATDIHGRYSLGDLAPGTYNLTVMREGYMGQRYGSKRPGEEQKGEPLELTAGATKSAIDLRMTPLGAIMGFVRDEDGDPVRQVDVSVLAYGYGPSGKGLQARGQAQTDALGEFRIFDLPAGAYYLRAKPQSAGSPGIDQMSDAYATVYYPNAQHQAGAGTVALTAGQELRGVDFVLHSVPVSFIRGRVIKPEGGRGCTTNLEAGADELQPSIIDTEAFATRVEVDGASVRISIPHQLAEEDPKFEFHNLPLGSYSLTATCMAGGQLYMIRMIVQLESAGLDNLELRPVGPSTITGQLRLEGESQSKLTEALVLVGRRNLYPNGGSDSEGGNPAEDGTFSLPNLPPAIYRISVAPPKALYVKSITQDGRDVRESGVDLQAGAMSISVQVVLSANGGSIEGSVENGADAQVTLIPMDPQAPLTPANMTVASGDGHFMFPAMAPGHYKLFAWDDGEDASAAIYDAEFRKRLESRGQTVEVQEKQKATAQLQLIPKVEK